MTKGEGSFDLATLRRKLAEKRGRPFWRSLEELAETPEFLARLAHEFPAFEQAARASPDRRRFLQLMAASIALAGMSGCGAEEEPRELSPHVEQPPGVIPGRPRYFATATGLDGFGSGVLLKHEMTRPIKVEGNPDHPASLGGTSAVGQASILGLYDPYRAQSIIGNGQIASWESAITMLTARRSMLAERGGQGFRLLTGAVTSPTLLAQIAALRAMLPDMQWHQWEPLHRDTLSEGARLAFGRDIDMVFDLTKADVIVGIESDLISGAPGHWRYGRDFAVRRRAGEVREAMSRVYALEATPTLIGAKADHRFITKPSESAAALRFIAATVGAGPADWSNEAAPHSDALKLLAADLMSHRGRSLLHAGREQPPEIHALCHAINQALGNFGQTLRAIEPVAAPVADGHARSLSTLTDDMAAGKVDTLLILSANAVYTAAADKDFGAALGRVGLSIYLGDYADETAERCHWHIPATHEYEAWGDIRAFDGTATIQQPQVRPLYGGHSAHEVLAVLLGETRPDDLSLLRAHWQHSAGESNFENFWRSSLRAGVVPNSAAPQVPVSLRRDYADAVATAASKETGLTLLFRPDIGVWDGRFAGNAWLQEVPRPLTRIAWDNAALIAPATAERLGVSQAELVELSLGARKLRAPVWILPGQAADCITLPLGYGRHRAGPVGSDVGFNAYLLRSADAPWQAIDAGLTRMDGKQHTFAVEQVENLVQGRDLIRDADLSTLLEDPASLTYSKNEATLYPGFPDDGIAWAMSISLNSCIGCQACVVACQAENNIPVVGKSETARGRAMHWLRIDRYYQGDLDDPGTAFQPVPCMHCENAPCEVVCPVQATMHDAEGVNVMVYNRCVGTRFCSNNCPYKVRRFNWFGYAYAENRPRESWNPDVTVRDRGVMEKCTYCVQRTRQTMIAANREDRPIRDGEVMTACQQACPTQAIVFGDRNDRDSAVARRKASPLDYPILDDLNTRPRTTYEMVIRNRNPDLKGG